MTADTTKSDMGRTDRLCEGQGNHDTMSADDAWTFVAQEQELVVYRTVPANNAELIK
jgi:hypothetical protein